MKVVMGQVLNVGLMLDIDLGISEKVAPNPGWYYNFYSIRAPIS